MFKKFVTALLVACAALSGMITGYFFGSDIMLSVLILVLAPGLLIKSEKYWWSGVTFTFSAATVLSLSTSPIQAAILGLALLFVLIKNYKCLTPQT